MLFATHTPSKPAGGDLTVSAGRVFLSQGDLYVTSGPQRIETILGSCLGIVFFCRRLRLGGMGHAIFPKQEAGSGHEARFYVDGAVRLLYRQFLRRGADPREIEVRLFGGGTVLPTNGRKGKSVGDRNIEVGRETLAELGLKPLQVLAGCKGGQKLILDLSTGTIELRFIEPINASEGRGFPDINGSCIDLDD